MAASVARLDVRVGKRPEGNLLPLVAAASGGVMDWIVLRLVHVVSGAFWFGAVFTNFLFVQPAVLGLGPDGQRVMVHVLRDRRFLDVVLGSAVLTAIAGAILFWRDSNGLDVGFILGAGVGFGSAVSPGCWLCSCSFSPDIRAPAGL